MGGTTGAPLKCVHVLRKPCSEPTVAANVLRWGTGALDIDATRISTSDNLNGGAYAVNPTERWDGAENWRYKRGEQGNAGEYQQPSGRWPANLILQHLDGCVQDGTRTVRGDGHFPSSRPSGSQLSGPEGHRGQTGLKERHLTSETVVAWTCAPGCPVAALDAQSGTSQSAAGIVNYARTETSGWRHRGGSFTPGHTWEAQGYGDSGGASRYFKQMKP